MNKKKITIIVVISLLILLVGGIITYGVLNDKKKDNTSGIKEIDFSQYETQELSSDLITSGGVYNITGDITKTIRVNAVNKDVKLILDNASIKTTSGPAIYIEEADNVYIELVGNNTIDSTTTQELNGAIFSKSDLCLLGDGSITITSNIDGIVGKDDVQFNSGTYTITSNDEGVVGKDSLTFKGGTYKIVSSGHGLKTSNEAEKGELVILNGTFDIESKGDSIHSIGNLNIEGGTINISSSDDGIHTDKDLYIKDAIINVNKAYEGIEGLNITVDSGIIKVVAEDDGFNAAGGDGSSQGRTGSARYSNVSNSNLIINGGNIYVNSQGDGIDSNGNIYITGGEVFVDGPTNNGNGAMDYGDGGSYKFEVTGGTLIAVGSSGMAVVPTSASVTSVLMNLSTSYNSEFKFGDITYKPSKSYNSILICSNKISQGNTYELEINNNTVTSVTLNNIITTSGTSGNQGGPGGGDHGGGPRRGW